MPSADCCIFRTGESCQRMQVKSVHNQTQQIADPQDRRASQSVVEQGCTVHLGTQLRLPGVILGFFSRPVSPAWRGYAVHYELSLQWALGGAPAIRQGRILAHPRLDQPDCRVVAIDWPTPSGHLHDPIMGRPPPPCPADPRHGRAYSGRAEIGAMTPWHMNLLTRK